MPFFRFLSLLGGFGGALWRGFCANIDCSLENATSQKAWFYLGISTVLTVAAGPGSIKGEKNTHAEAMPVLGSRKTAPQTIFDDFREPRGATFWTVFDKMLFFSESVFSSILGCLWGGSRRQRRGPSSLRICRI